MTEQPAPTDKSTMQLIDRLHPRVAFWSGVVSSGGLIFAIGLIVLAVLMFQHVDLQQTAAPNNTNVDVYPTITLPNILMTADSMRNKRGTGDLTIVEFSDTECPFCKRFHPIMQQVVEDYDGQVAWAYKHLPLTTVHPKSKKEAIATECAALQDKFWEYLDLIFETTNSNNSLPDEAIYSTADAVGLDRTQFDLCISNEDTQAQIAQDAAEAEQMGVTGTPYSFLVDADGKVIEIIPGALDYSAVKALIDSHL
jgi:protein-disulfide isomerase